MDTHMIIGLAAIVVGAVIGFLMLRNKKQKPEQMPAAGEYVPYAPEPTAVENVLPYRNQPISPQLESSPALQPEYGMGTVPLVPDQQAQGDPYYGPSFLQNNRNYTLCAISGALKGSIFSLQDSDCLMGRSAACQIRFSPDTPGVSGRHCLVAVDGNGTVTVTDVGSTYGTYLSNGQRLVPNQPQPIRPGDAILLAGLDGPAFLLEQQ